MSVLTGLGTSDVSLVIANDEYNGETRQRVKWVNPIGNGPRPGNPMSDQEKASFAARMKGRTMHIQPQAKPTEAASPAGTQDDIPF